MNGLLHGKLKSLPWELQEEEQMFSWREGAWLTADRGFCWEEILTGRAAMHRLWGIVKGDGSTHSCPVWYRFLQDKQRPAKPPTYRVSHLPLCYPPAHAFPSPFIFSCWAQDLNFFETGGFQMQAPSSASVAFCPSFKDQAEEGTHNLPHNSTLQHSLKPYRIYSLLDKLPFASLCLMCWVTSLFDPVFFSPVRCLGPAFPWLSNEMVLVLHLHSHQHCHVP